LGWGEPGQARPDRLQRPAVADARQRRRPESEQLRRRVLRPRAFAERLQLREPLIAEEVDVRALAAWAHDAIAAAERLRQVAVDDVRARQLADGEATGLRVEHLSLEHLRRLDEHRARRETRGQAARADGECELGEETLHKFNRLVIHTRKWAPDNYITGFNDEKVEAHDPIDLLTEGGKASSIASKQPFWLGAPELKDVVAGKVPGRQTPAEITCFNNNIGLGIQFAALGKVIFDDAKAKGLGREVPTDWFLETVHP